jgi:hypothetical protein
MCDQIGAGAQKPPADGVRALPAREAMCEPARKLRDAYYRHYRKRCLELGGN